MKNLLVIPVLFLSVFSIAQKIEGIDTDHLPFENESKNSINEKYTVKRIPLKTGVELEYVEQGNVNGVPVLFLHGISDSWHSFETNLPHLPSRIHAFAISQRGHGNSDKPANAYNTKLFAADVASFIEQQKLGPVVIVGHSMGGVNAQRFAVDYPQLTKALVIIDSDPALIKNQGMTEFIDLVMKMKEPALSREFMVEFQKSTIMKPIDSTYFETIVNEGLKVPTAVFQSALKEVLEHNLVEDIKSIKKPVMIFWGEKDLVCLREGQEILKSNIKNAKWNEYKGIGHALHWEEPVRFVNDLLQFINSLQ